MVMNINMDKARQPVLVDEVLEKGKRHQEALKKMDEFEQDHYTMYNDFKELGIDIIHPVAEEYNSHSSNQMKTTIILQQPTWQHMYWIFLWQQQCLTSNWRMQSKPISNFKIQKQGFSCHQATNCE